jgi:serine/threonine-protein kinase
MDKYIGKKLDGRYEIQDFIGIGGMAIVYRAYDVIDDRIVAIKILKDEYLRNEEFKRRFKNESKAIAVLSHPNIVKVYDVSFGDRIQYIVMEYIDGITLKEYIEKQQVVSWQESVHFTVQILRALQHAHEKGIIHRDIKPQNMILLGDGTIKVTDFGIARFAKSETRTMTDKAIGSVHYIAPEQARGDLTDAQADIYSVGVMLYEMLTGKLPFEAESAVSVAIMQLQSDPTPPREINPNIPEGLEEMTLKAMQKDPSKRYESAASMLRDIELFKRNPNIKFRYQYSAIENTAEFERNELKQASINKVKNDDGVQKGPRDAAKNKKLIMGVSIAVVAVVAIVMMILVFRSCTSAKDVEIPNFVGSQYNDVIAKQASGEYKFNFIKEDGHDISKPEGQILDQNPKYVQGKKVKDNIDFKLIVNNLGGNVVVPDVTKMKQEDAVSKLKEVSLVANIVTIVDDETAKGIVKSTDPVANSAVPKNSKVNVYVSSGPSDTKTQVPNVINIDLDSAKKKIESSGLKVGSITTKDSSKSANTVLESDPLPTTSVKSGSAVNLIVSSGKKPQSSIDINVQLPSGVNKDMVMKVYINGQLANSYTKTVNPSYNGYASFAVTGSGGASTVVVTLDDQKYWTYNINFDTSKVTDTKNPDYKPPSTSSTS